MGSAKPRPAWQRWSQGAQLPGLRLCHTALLWPALPISACSIGYRTAANGDVQLPSSLANKVHIYTSASTGNKDPKVSVLRSTLLREPFSQATSPPASSCL